MMQGTQALKRKTRRERAYDLVMKLMAPLARLVARTSLVPTTAFLEGRHFPWVATLEANWRDIRTELDGLLTFRDDLPAFHLINRDATDIGTERWKSFFFYGFGVRSDANCARCPRTAALLAKIPGMTTAFFSILEPGARLPRHHGPWKGVIRYHLGLMVPAHSEKCGIEVGGEVAHWQEGKSMIFDDTYPHSVWNDTDETRAVLFLDIIRPCRIPGAWINWAVVKAAAMTPFVRSSIRHERAWETQFMEKRARAAVPPASSADGASDGGTAKAG
jgi:aspartyl/asparaginyl beta-hydroxylase (cupin superfamily)